MLFGYLFRNGNFILFYFTVITKMHINAQISKFGCDTKIEAIIKRSYKNSGFHKDLVTEIELVPGFPYQIPMGPYELLIKETFPTSIYVDPYQMALLKHFKGPDVLVPSFVNVELPAYKAEELNVFVYLSSRYLTTKLKIPIHLRYMQPQKCHSADSGKYVSVHLPNPSIAIKSNSLYCPRSFLAPCNSSSQNNCTWLMLSSSFELSSLDMQVPVGCVEHLFIVCFLTVFTIIIGIIIIYVTSKRTGCAQFKDE